MKKFLFIALLSGLMLQVSAQHAVHMPLVAGDSIVNTGTASKVIPLTAGYSGIAVEVLLTKNSGTGAGTIKLQGSNDGTNYTQIGSTFTITDVATQSTMFYVVAPLPQYIKVLGTGSGTENVTLSVYYRLPYFQTQ